MLLSWYSPVCVCARRIDSATHATEPTMPHISAFRGLRYDLGHVGSMDTVIAPDPSVIDSAMQKELYEQHPANAIRIVDNRKEPGDAAAEGYSRAGRFLKHWQQEGVLQREPDPAIYVYHQLFEHEGRHLTRRGFICNVRIPDDGAEPIRCVQPLDDAALADRRQLIDACKASVDPMLATYSDPTHAIQEQLEGAIVGVAPLEVRDSDATIHRIWPVTDIRVINDVTSSMSPKAAHLLAGRASFAAAEQYRNENDLASRPEHGANHVMMTFVDTHDPGLFLASPHRVVHGIPPVNSDELKTALTRYFDVRISGEGADLAEMIWDQIEIEDDQTAIGFFCPADGRWMIAKLNGDGLEELSKQPGSSEEDGLLAAQIYDRLVVDLIPGGKQASDTTLLRSVEEVMDVTRSMEDGDESTIGLVALMIAPTIEDLVASRVSRSLHDSGCIRVHPPLVSGLLFSLHEK